MTKKIILLFIFLFFYFSIFLPFLSPDEFDFELKKVYPKIVTPSYGRDDNNFVFFEFYDPLAGATQFELKIFDINGYRIKNIDTSNNNWKTIPSSQNFKILWDCKDSEGNYVLPGVYIYQLESSKKTFTGIIVVAQ